MLPPGAVARRRRLALDAAGGRGLTTAEIARAYLVPEATMAQRISRAKQRIRDAGATFAPARRAERAERLRVVLQVLYLMFNEGYTAMSGPALLRPDLTAEAIRLAREVHRLVPDDGEVAGLLALMLLIDARRPARTGADGALVPLAEQDRSRLGPRRDRRGRRAGHRRRSPPLASARTNCRRRSPRVHDEAPTATETDWPQILALYRLLERMAPGPTVTLNRAVAEAMVHGPQAGLDLLATVRVDERVSGAHRFDAVRAHLLEMAGDLAEAGRGVPAAARRTASIPERRHLLARERHGWRRPNARRDASGAAHRLAAVGGRPPVDHELPCIGRDDGDGVDVDREEIPVLRRLEATLGLQPGAERRVLAGIGRQHCCSADLGVSHADFGGAGPQAPRIPRDAVDRNARIAAHVLALAGAGHRPDAELAVVEVRIGTAQPWCTITPDRPQHRVGCR